MGTTVPIKSKGKLEEFRNYYRNTEPNPRNYALIVLGLNSALRIGDILSLRWKDVYFSEKKTYREHISIVEKKTGKRNVLAINAPSQEALEYYRATLNRLDDDQFIFSSQKKPHNGICRSQAFRIIKKAAQSCGSIVRTRRPSQLSLPAENIWLSRMEKRLSAGASHDDLQPLFL